MSPMEMQKVTMETAFSTKETAKTTYGNGFFHQVIDTKTHSLEVKTRSLEVKTRSLEVKTRFLEVKTPC